MKRQIVPFYALTLAVSWIVWAPWVASAQGVRGFPSSPYLHLLGSLGPAIAALLILHGTEGCAGVRQLVRRTVTARAAWVTIIWAVAVPTAVFVVAALVLGRANDRAVHWSNLGAIGEYPRLGPVQYGLASLVFYGFGEELGWRGFLYPLLRRRFRPLSASLLVVPFWAFWHVPLFFATESYRAMGIGGVAGWLVSLVSGSVLTAWMSDRAKGSILPAAVLHAVLDIYFLADVGLPVQSTMGAGVTVCGVAVAIAQFRHGRDGGTRPA